MRLRRLVIAGGIGALLLFAAMQIVPYGKAHVNPPVRQEPAWDTPQTRALAVRACYDCHSNETVWPWYTNVAPMSWLVQRDVEQGRRALNLSEWDREQDEAEDSADTVEDGEMPPERYVLLHPSANLSPDERAALIRGLEATFDEESGRGRGRGRGGDAQTQSAPPASPLPGATPPGPGPADHRTRGSRRSGGGGRGRRRARAGSRSGTRARR